MRPALLIIALGAMSTLYAFSSPVGGSPDEDAHMVYAWGVMSGQGFGGPDIPCDDPLNRACPNWGVEVPVNFAPDNRCYIAKVQIEAACAGQHSDTLRPTTAYQFPPPYYVVTGTALRIADGLGASGQTVGFAGRLASIALSLALLGPAVLYARGPTLAAFQVALTPMSFFLVGSINPSGIEISAAVAVAVSIVRLAQDNHLETVDGSRRGPEWLLIASLGWLAWARPLGSVWVALASVTAFLFLSRSIRLEDLRHTLRSYSRVWIAASFWTATAMGWLAFSYEKHTSGSITRRVTLPEPGSETVAAVLLRWGGILWESFGFLGWLDTRPPLLVMLSIWAAIVIVASERLGHPEHNLMRRRVAIAFAAATVVLITAAMWHQGFLWQGRYALPLLAAGIVLLSGVPSQRQFISTTFATRLWAISTGLTALWLYARHVFGLQTGARHFVPDLSGEAQWWGPLGLTPYMVLALLSTALLVYVAYRSSVEQPAPAEPATAPSVPALQGD